MIEIIGKNGAGKSYIANSLYKCGFDRNISYTTRPMRDGEINGVDYFFISIKEFENMLANNEFIDYKKRNQNYYGMLRKNMHENTILVAGNTEKIEKDTSLKVKKLYINSSIVTRYLRVKWRKDSLLDIFDRFHTENFLYLDNFNAAYLNNDLIGQDILNKTLELLTNEEELKKYSKSNYDFLKEEVNSFDFISLEEMNDMLLKLLCYEEYILRKISLAINLDIDGMKKEYYYRMKDYLKYNKLVFSENNNTLIVNIDNNNYVFDYREMKKVKL